MMEGVVSGGIEAMMSLQLIGHHGQREEIVAVLDTGFTGDLTLPPSSIHDLEFMHVATNEVTLADDSTVEVPVFLGLIDWFGVQRTILVLQTDSDPLVGMTLMQNCRLTMDIIPDGHFTIVSLTSNLE